MKKGFTLVELLVVIGILVLLMSVLITGFANAPKKAEMAKCQELVKNTETALTVLFNQEGMWPNCLLRNSNSQYGLDATAAYPLAGAGMALSSKKTSHKLTVLDRFGIVTPWAAKIIETRGESCKEDTPVPMGGTIRDHRLRYAIDDDGDGKILGVNVASTLPADLVNDKDAKDSESNDSRGIRATAVVWCIGPKGKIVKSWTDAQRIR